MAPPDIRESFNQLLFITLLSFRDTRIFDIGRLSDDQIACDFLIGSQYDDDDDDADGDGDLDDDDDVSWELLKFAYTDICDEYAQMKSLRIKRPNSWITQDIIKYMYEGDVYTPRLHRTMIRLDKRKLRQKVTCATSERKMLILMIFIYVAEIIPRKCGEE